MFLEEIAVDDLSVQLALAFGGDIKPKEELLDADTSGGSLTTVPESGGVDDESANEDENKKRKGGKGARRSKKGPQRQLTRRVPCINPRNLTFSSAVPCKSLMSCDLLPIQNLLENQLLRSCCEMQPRQGCDVW